MTPRQIESFLRRNRVMSADPYLMPFVAGTGIFRALPTLAQCFRLVRWVATCDITTVDPLEWATEVRERAEKIMGVS